MFKEVKCVVRIITTEWPCFKTGNLLFYGSFHVKEVVVIHNVMAVAIMDHHSAYRVIPTRRSFPVDTFVKEVSINRPSIFFSLTTTFLQQLQGQAVCPKTLYTKLG